MNFQKIFKYFLTFAVILAFPLLMHLNIKAATLSLSPASAALTAGRSYDMQIIVNTEGVGIVSADVRVNYDPTKVTIVGITAGPIFSVSTTQDSIASNYLTISRAIPNGGTPYNGSNGLYATIRFTARETGTANFTIPFTTETTSPSILASGSTNLLTAVNNASYGITAEVLGTSTPLPDTSIFDDLGFFTFVIGFLAIIIGGNEIYQLKKKADLIYNNN